MSKPYRPTDHTPSEWLAKAAKCENQACDSFERCDTDGFLSQWASQKMASEYRTLAQLAENGGTWDFITLTDLDGNLLDARNIKTRYGWSWAITDADGTTSWFNESSARSGKRRQAAHAKKGIRMVTVRRPAIMWPGGSIEPDMYTDVEPIMVGEIEYADY